MQLNVKGRRQLTINPFKNHQPLTLLHFGHHLYEYLPPQSLNQATVFIDEMVLGIVLYEWCEV